MLTQKLSDQSLPQDDLIYAAFRLAASDTLMQIEMAATSPVGMIDPVRDPSPRGNRAGCSGRSFGDIWRDIATRRRISGRATRVRTPVFTDDNGGESKEPLLAEDHVAWGVLLVERALRNLPHEGEGQLCADQR